MNIYVNESRRQWSISALIGMDQIGEREREREREISKLYYTRDYDSRQLPILSISPC